MISFRRACPAGEQKIQIDGGGVGAEAGAALRPATAMASYGIEDGYRVENIIIRSWALNSKYFLREVDFSKDLVECPEWSCNDGQQRMICSFRKFLFIGVFRKIQ